jgi:hypothetical protein
MGIAFTGIALMRRSPALVISIAPARRQRYCAAVMNSLNASHQINTVV